MAPVNSLADVQGILNQIKGVDLSDSSIEQTLSGFVYAGFNAVEMWKMIGSTPGFDPKDIALLICACLQKGYGLKKFSTKVKQTAAKNTIDAIVLKYNIKPTSKDSSDPTLQRIVSTSGIIAFNCYQHVLSKGRLNLAVPAASLGLKCPDVVGCSFINSIIGTVTETSVWEPVLIVNEYLQAQVTMKTMSEENKKAQNITTVAEAMLKNRAFSEAARSSPIVPSGDDRMVLLNYFRGTNYNFSPVSRIPEEISPGVYDDLKLIHKTLFTPEFRVQYQAIGKIGALMKSCTQAEFPSKLTVSYFNMA
ncbi:nucleocapsid [Melon chlorotic spot virus]|uniref:Nucleoprotein n=1 Tax=Melon chlorotic spot virus TaxID=2479459 RepID=A0A3G1Z1B7_9VIRU|nr:nucleocapsid [Melon chlorotic spot virus]AYL40771.1 nucleocapsid [Melon chlorotic spot virus]